MVRLPLTVIASLALAACGAVPDGRQSERPAASQARIPAAAAAVSPSTAASRMCLATLGASGASFEALPDRYLGPGCHQLGTVQLARLSSDEDRIEVTRLGPLACPVANTFAGWVRFGVDRAARQYLGSRIARVETMGSYACRNVAGTARLSAHATAEAIDIAAFVLEDGRRVSVEQDWHAGSSAEQSFLRVVHQSACKRFGTVLGPDYNAAHADHLHIEKERQGPSFCR